ncbi:MAG: CBS domain-containing protein [Spirochaetaceae bacterium]
METVKDILSHKGTDVWAVNPDTKVRDALKLMKEKNIGALLVVDKNEELQGIFSERDYARKTDTYHAEGSCPADENVDALMTKSVVYIKDNQTVDQCMAIMTDKRLRHLPVLHEDKIGGLISIGDVVKAVIHEKDFIIDQMEHYIWDNS